MSLKFFLISVLSLATVGNFALPGRADQAIIQEVNQESVVTGNNNYVQQNARQFNSNYSAGNRRNNQGTVQRINQRSDVLGNNNTNIQNANQSNVTRTRFRR
ncbi:MAG TPA: hypothetical protein V6C58_00725 [Allocoleopsis sp.]